MINYKFPSGLIPKIQDRFYYEKEELADGNIKIEFILKNGVSNELYNTNVSCGG